MKKSILICILILTIACTQIRAQQESAQTYFPGDGLTAVKPESTDEGAEEYGGTLNIGLGFGYYSYIVGAFPVMHANYEFDILKNFTVAPFISVYTYRNYVLWGNQDFTYRYYSFRRTVIPVGAKASYYFDELLNANESWDFYGAASIGFTLATIKWEGDYYGLRKVNRGTDPLFINLHAGAKYHVRENTSVFFDLSPSMTTLGLSLYVQ